MNNTKKSTNKIMDFSLRLLEIIIQCIVIISFSIMVLLAGVDMPDSAIWKCFAFVIPVILAYFIRRRIKRFEWNIILYICIVVSAFVFGTNDAECFFYAVILLLIVGYSYRLKLESYEKADLSEMPLSNTQFEYDEKNEDEKKRLLHANEQMSVYFGVSMVVGYLIGGVVNRPLIQSTEVVLFVLFVLFQVVYNNLKNLNTVLIRNVGKSEFPAEQIKRVNAFIILVLVIFMFLGMMVFYHGKYGNIFGLIGSGSLIVLREVLRFILMIWGSGSGSSSLAEEETEADTDDSILDGDVSSGESTLLQAISMAITITIAVAAIIGFVYLLVRYFRSINKTRKENHDLVEYVKPESSIAKNSVRKNYKKQNKIPNNNLKFRKHYKKRVQKGYGLSKPDPHATPAELTKKAITKEAQEADRITNLYEKARYSEHMITDDEVNIIKKHS